MLVTADIYESIKWRIWHNFVENTRVCPVRLVGKLCATAAAGFTRPISLHSKEIHLRLYINSPLDSLFLYRRKAGTTTHTLS